MQLSSVLTRTREVCRRKHLAWATEEAYTGWIRRYASFLRALSLKNLDRGLSSEAKFERFLTRLATSGCAASTQNQAFNAILFLYKEVLGKPWERVQALRAKRPPQVRTAPSRQQVASLLEKVDDVHDYPTRLLVQLLYGCGLRVSEPLNLRIKDVDLENSRLVIRDAKGGKSRVVPLPCSLVPPLQEQMRKARLIWEADQLKGVPVPLPGRLGFKYPKAAKSWAWYWLFPAHRPCKHPRSGEVVRWRVHESNVQKAVRWAARKCNLEGAVTPHVLRHAYATHVMQQGAYVRDVQVLLGHNSLETTMQYLHTEAGRVQSPLESLTASLPPPSSQMPQAAASAVRSERRADSDSREEPSIDPLRQHVIRPVHSFPPDLRARFSGLSNTADSKASGIEILPRSWSAVQQQSRNSLISGRGTVGGSVGSHSPEPSSRVPRHKASICPSAQEDTPLYPAPFPLTTAS